MKVDAEINRRSGPKKHPGAVKPILVKLGVMERNRHADWPEEEQVTTFDSKEDKPTLSKPCILSIPKSWVTQFMREGFL